MIRVGSDEMLSHAEEKWQKREASDYDFPVFTFATTAKKKRPFSSQNRRSLGRLQELRAPLESGLKRASSEAGLIY